jgi:hypothetical protein
MLAVWGHFSNTIETPIKERYSLIVKYLATLIHVARWMHDWSEHGALCGVIEQQRRADRMQTEYRVEIGRI